MLIYPRQEYKKWVKATRKQMTQIVSLKRLNTCNARALTLKATFKKRKKCGTLYQ